MSITDVLGGRRGSALATLSTDDTKGSSNVETGCGGRRASATDRRRSWTENSPLALLQVRRDSSSVSHDPFGGTLNGRTKGSPRMAEDEEGDAPSDASDCTGDASPGGRGVARRMSVSLLDRVTGRGRSMNEGLSPTRAIPVEG